MRNLPGSVNVFDGAGGVRPANVPTQMGRHSIERFFQADQSGKNKLHELFFGSPQQTVDTRMATKWQSRGEWPVDYIGRNLYRASNIIWYMAEIQQMNAWVNEIAPMWFTNNLSFTVQRKIFSDDGADFIGLTGVPSEVSSHIIERTRSGVYIGKGTTMNANMFSSPEGVRELWEKFMQIAVAISKTELFEFFDQVRKCKYAEIETHKMKLVQRPSEYFNREKFQWDIARKRKNGIQSLISDISMLVSTYQGKLDTMMVPNKLMSILKFKPEYSDDYLNGSQTTTFRRKVDASVVPDRSAHGNLNKTGMVADICGMKVRVIRPLLSTTMDIYQSVLATYTQIGTHVHLYNKKDEELQDPKSFEVTDLQVQVYDEEQDCFRIIKFETCLSNDIVFDQSAGGRVREIARSNLGIPADQFHDPFVNIVRRDVDAEELMRREARGMVDVFGMDVEGPIRLIGQMNIRDRHHRSQWPTYMKYCGETLLNHFGNPRKFISQGDMQDFRRMFRRLESISFDEGMLRRFLLANSVVQQNQGRGAQQTVYATDGFYELAQVPGTGFYNFATHNGFCEIPFGCANIWAIEAISKLDPMRCREGIDREMVHYAQKFVDAFNMHRDNLKMAFPECQFIKNPAAYSPSVFQYPDHGYNLYVNTMHNATNFLWAKFQVYGNSTIGQLVADADENHRQHFAFIKRLCRDTRGPRWPTDGQRVPMRGVPVAQATQAVINDIDNVYTLHGADSLYDDDDYDPPGLQASGTPFLQVLRRGRVVVFDEGQGDYYYDEDGRNPNGITRAWLSSLFQSLWQDFTARHQVFTTAGLYRYLISDAVGIPGQAMTLAEFEDMKRAQARGRAPDADYLQFRRTAEKVRNAFMIYANARLTGGALLAAENLPAVRTSLTLTPTLKRSIAYSQGYGSLYQTRFAKNPQGLVTETYVPITEGDAPGTSCDSIMNPARDFVPFHVWYIDEYSKPAYELNVATFLRNESLHADSFTDVFRGTFTDTMELVVSPFVKSATSCMLMSDMNSRNMLGMQQMRACPPIEYLLMRPHMEYRTFPAIFIQSGGDAAFRIRGNPLFMMGLAPTRGVLYYRYAQSSGTIIVAEENIFVQENVLVDTYIGGSNTKFYSPSEMAEYVDRTGRKYYDPYDDTHGIEGDCSIFAVAVPIGYSKNAPMDIDMTGHYHELVDKNWQHERIFGKPPHYPTAFRFQNFWNLSVERQVTEDDIEYVKNTRCCRDRAIYKVDGKWDLETTASSHWGNECTGPNMQAFRGGNGSSPTKEYPFQ